MSYISNNQTITSWNKRALQWLFALVLNLNIMDIVLSSGTNSLLKMFVMALFCVLSYITYIKDNRIRINNLLTFAVFLYIGWSFATVLFFCHDNLMDLIKFIVCLLFAYFAGMMDEYSFIITIDKSLVISTLFSIYTWVNYSSIYRKLFTTGVANRLTVTLPLGLGLTFALACLVCSPKGIIRRILYISSALIQAICLLQYSARGNLIFPAIVFVILLIMQSRVSRRKKIRNFVMIAVGVVAFVYLFNRYASASMIKRMTRLFTDTESESRVPIYKYLISDIWKNGRFLIGSGFGGSADIMHAAGFSERYPHNFILELVGEGGILGVLLIGVTTYFIINAELFRIRSLQKIGWREKNTDVRAFFLLNSGLLFFVFNFFKSYSIYDGYQLFAFIALVLAFRRKGEKS